MIPVVERCRTLRRDATDAEQQLWSMLRNRQLGGFKFRRQYAFGPYVLDFFCLREKLAVEADGGSHFTPEGQARDRVRTAYLRDHEVLKATLRSYKTGSFGRIGYRTFFSGVHFAYSRDACLSMERAGRVKGAKRRTKFAHP